MKSAQEKKDLDVQTSTNAKKTLKSFPPFYSLSEARAVRHRHRFRHRTQPHFWTIFLGSFVIRLRLDYSLWRQNACYWISLNELQNGVALVRFSRSRTYCNVPSLLPHGLGCGKLTNPAPNCKSKPGVIMAHTGRERALFLPEFEQIYIRNLLFAENSWKAGKNAPRPPAWVIRSGGLWMLWRAAYFEQNNQWIESWNMDFSESELELWLPYVWFGDFWQRGWGMELVRARTWRDDWWLRGYEELAVFGYIWEVCPSNSIWFCIHTNRFIFKAHLYKQ